MVGFLNNRDIGIWGVGRRRSMGCKGFFFRFSGYFWGLARNERTIVIS
jgi:hypothetical protein